MHEYGKRKEKGSNVMNSKKRMLAGALCLATIGFGSTVSAASVDPFSPVPLESGLYEEVAALIHDGLIYGYSDSTFDKSHMISRYEMAIFVSKANASYSKANAADKARIKRLVDQFSDELKGMGVNTAKTLGTSATEASAEEAEPQTSVYNADDEDTGFTMNSNGEGLQMSGQVLMQWNNNKARQPYYNGYKAGSTTPLSTKYKSDESDKNFDVELKMKTVANIGAGWQGHLNFYAARDRSGEYRSNSNSDGHFDITELYAEGPVNKRSNLLFGRVRGTTFDSIAMAEYWTGARWTQKVNPRLTVHFSYGKPDYEKDTSLRVRTDDHGNPMMEEVTSGGKTSYRPIFYTTEGDDLKGRQGTSLNPANTGTTFESIEANYKFNKKLQMNVALWDIQGRHTNYYSPAYNIYPAGDESTSLSSQNSSPEVKTTKAYDSTWLSELGFVYKPTKKWKLGLNLSHSDRERQNDGVILQAQYGKMNKEKPHTWKAKLAVGRTGYNSYIRSKFSSLRDDDYGAKGVELSGYYIPRKNLEALFTYTRTEQLDHGTGAQFDYSVRRDVSYKDAYRAELIWFF